MTTTTNQFVTIYDHDYGNIDISVPTDREVTRDEILDLVLVELREDPETDDATKADLNIGWADCEGLPDNVTTYSIKEITQEQIDDLRGDVEGYVGNGYDIVAQGMGEASEAWAEQNGFDASEVLEIIELDNYSIKGDEKQIQMTANSIRRWNPEHRARLLELLSK